MNKGHIAEYIKGAEKAKMKDDKDSDDKEPVKKPANRLVMGVIDAIRATTTKDVVTTNVIRVHIKKANKECIR